MAKNNALFSKVATDGKHLSAQIADIKGRNATLTGDVHMAAVGCVVQAALHGNMTPAMDLIDALGEAWRLKALFEQDEDAAIAKIMATTYWQFKPENIFEGWDFDKVLASALSKADKILADPEQRDHPKTKIDPTKLAALRMVVTGVGLDDDDKGGNPAAEQHATH